MAQKSLAWPRLNYRPPARPAAELGIGIIGAGGIVRHGHLPAYRAAGFNVVGLAARRAEQVDEMAGAFGVAGRYTDYRSLLDDPRVRIVDVAVPGEARLEIVRAAAAAGKHLLVQKPLADTLEEARAIVALCQTHNVLLAVNHNARWAPAYRAAHSLLREEFLGQVFDIVHEMRDSQESAGFFREGWFARVPRFQILQYAIHHVDLMRLWMGRSPLSVTAHLSRKPGQVPRGEMQSSLLLDYGPEATALLIDRNASWPGEPGYNRFTIEGTRGMISGEARANKLTVRQENYGDRVWHPQLAGSWFPGSFAATLGNLMDAVTTGAPLEVSGAENLETMAVIEAAYESAASGHAVRLVGG